MPDSPPPQTPLPESLRTQLEEFRRELWRAKISEAIFAGIFGLLFSFLVVFALDRFWPTPAVLRLAILLAGTSLSAVFAPMWLHRWVWKHRRESQLARLIALKHPGLGDRLLGVIDLASQTESADTLSPRLRAAAMEDVAAEASRRKLGDALPQSRHRRWSLAVLVVFLGAGAALTMVPEAGMNALKRWLFPLSATPRYTFTELQEIPAKLPVPLGEAFALDLTLAPTSRWQPVSGSARYGKQDPVTAALADGRYRFEFPGQQERGWLRVEIGDAVHRILVIPSLRPAVTRSTADVRYPAYLQRSDESIEMATGFASVVEGAEATLRIETDRALSEAFSGTEDSETAMTVNGNTASTPPIQVGKEPLSVPLRWTDTVGLAGNPGFELRIEGTADEAPSIYLDGLNGGRAMLPTETVEFGIIGTDDFGLREVGLEWTGETPLSGGEETTHGDLTLETGAPDRTRSTVPAAFCPQTFGIRPQKLLLRAWATDYLPDRGRIYSQPVTLYILTMEEHAQMLKQQFDRVIGEMEDLARKERDLFEENQRLERLDANELSEEDAKRRLADQHDEEDRQAQAMKELAERLEELLKDSTRNETIDPDTIRRMAETMKSMRDLAEKGMPGVSGKLGDAGDPKNTDEKTERDMSEAVEQQAEVLEELRDAIEKANDANRQFEANTFVSRLKKAADDQQRITGGAMAESDHFGLRTEELDPSVIGRLADLNRMQQRNASDIRWIEDDLGHFFTRTEKADYGAVLEAMRESDIGIGLESIRREIAENRASLAATGSHQWAGTLREWAKMLEDAANAAGGGGGGGGGASPDEDFEFMLRVMRLVQEEQDIRARTRALETLRRSLNHGDAP